MIYSQKALLMFKLSQNSYVFQNFHFAFLARPKLELHKCYNIQTQILVSTYVNLFKVLYEEIF